MNNTFEQKYQLLTIRELVSLSGFSRSAINLKIASGLFPKPIYQSQNKRLWKASDYQEWVDGLASKKEISCNNNIEVVKL